MTMTDVEVSIVLCSHRRFDMLTRAVESLLDQTVSPDCYEVIVVDNDGEPNPDIQKLVLNATKRMSIKYLHESKLGLSHARNAGGRSARSDYIGYIDDDAKANPRYIDILIQILDTHRPDICGGPYYPFFQDAKPRWFKDAYGTHTHGNKARFLSQREALSGGNIIFARCLLERIGWFDPQLGMKGKRIGYGEETMAQIRAREIYPQTRIYYDPELFVYHLVPAHKMSIIYQIRRAYKIGTDQAFFWIDQENLKNVQYKAFWVFFRTVARLFSKELIEIIFRDSRRYQYWQNYVYEETSQRFRVLGAQISILSNFIRSRTNRFCRFIFKGTSKNCLF